LSGKRLRGKEGQAYIFHDSIGQARRSVQLVNQVLDVSAEDKGVGLMAQGFQFALFVGRENCGFAQAVKRGAGRIIDPFEALL
jgi:hypothetical protein